MKTLTMLAVVTVLQVGCAAKSESKTTPTPANKSAAKSGKSAKTNPPPAEIPVALPATKEDAIAAIKDLGAGVREEKGELTVVYLMRTNVTDAQLVNLTLASELKFLKLDGTKIGDAGLVHLKGLTKLQALSLDGTQVTDAGLVHLEGLTSLKRLFLHGTKVTDAGVKTLQAALPSCEIFN